MNQVSINVQCCVHSPITLYVNKLGNKFLHDDKHCHVNG